MKCEAKTEKEMREAKVPRPKTPEQLQEYINSLIDMDHDYGTSVYAMSMAAVAAFNYVAGKVGVSGFQASCADLDIIRRLRLLEMGFQILNFEHLLYPQYCNEEHFPSMETLVLMNKEDLANEARKRLLESPNADTTVKAHWMMLSNLSPTKEKENGQKDIEETQGYKSE